MCGTVGCQHAEGKVTGGDQRAEPHPYIRTRRGFSVKMTPDRTLSIRTAVPQRPQRIQPPRRNRNPSSVPSAPFTQNWTSPPRRAVASTTRGRRIPPRHARLDVYVARNAFRLDTDAYVRPLCQFKRVETCQVTFPPRKTLHILPPRPGPLNVARNDLAQFALGNFVVSVLDTNLQDLMDSQWPCASEFGILYCGGRQGAMRGNLNWTRSSGITVFLHHRTSEPFSSSLRTI